MTTAAAASFTYSLMYPSTVQEVSPAVRVTPATIEMAQKHGRQPQFQESDAVPRLHRQQIFDYLQDAPPNPTGLIPCAGCRRALEREFIDLDHIFPRDEAERTQVRARRKADEASKTLA